MRGDDAVELSTGHEPTTDDDRVDTASIANLCGLVTVEQHQIRSLADADGALRALSGEERRRVHGRCSKRLQRREPRSGHPFQLVVKTEAWHEPIAARQEAYTARQLPTPASRAMTARSDARPAGSLK